MKTKELRLFLKVKCSFIVVLGLFHCNNICSQEIPYNDNIDFSSKLFMGTPLDNGNAAEISTTIRLNIVEYYRDSIVIEVIAVMDTTYSWIRDDYKNVTSSIKHEKFHFMLSEIYARRLRSIFLANKYKYSNYKENLYPQYRAIRDDLRSCQTEYDEETKHGINFKKQDEWMEYINSELLELKEYSNSRLVLLIEK